MDCDNIGEVSKDREMEGTRLMYLDPINAPSYQAWYELCIDVLLRVVASFGPKIVSEVISEHLILKNIVGTKKTPVLQIQAVMLVINTFKLCKTLENCLVWASFC